MSRWILALAIMLLYLAVAFVLGLLAGRGRSAWSVSEFAVANRELGLVLMWFLMGGTIFSAFAFLGGPGWAYSRGAASFYILAYSALGMLPWYLIGPKVARLGQRRGYFTMGDFIRDRYGSTLLGVIVGVVAVLAFIQYLTLQIKGMAYVFEVLTDGHVPFWAGALLAYGIVVAYVSTSGVRGAAWSDVFQGLLMLVVAWGMGLYLVYTLHGGPGPMFEAIDQARPGFLRLGGPGSTMSPMAYSTAVLVSVLGFIMWPHLFMKSFSTSERRIKQTVLAYPLFAIFLLPVLFIGFAGVLNVPPEALDNPDQVLPYMLTNLLPASGWLFGLIGAGTLAAAMSSADAITHGAAVELTRDVVLPLAPNLSEREQVWIMRAAVVIIGAAAYWLAIFGAAGLVQLLLGAYGSIVQFAPLVYGALYWPRATGAGAVSGLVVGVLVNYYFQLVHPATPLDINPGILGLLANIVVFAAVSLATRPASVETAQEFVEA